MVQLGKQAHKAIKTTEQPSVKCCGEACRCCRSTGEENPPSRVWSVLGAEPARGPGCIVGRVSDGAVRPRGWRHCQ